MGVDYKAVHVFRIVGEPEMDAWISFLFCHVAEDPYNTPFGVVIDWRRAERPWTPDEAERGLEEIAPLVRGRLARQAWVVRGKAWIEAFEWVLPMLAGAQKVSQSRYQIFEEDLAHAVEWAGDY